MSYSKQNFKDGNILTASELNKMDDAIYALDYSSSIGNMQILTLPDLAFADVSADIFNVANRYVDGKGFIATRFIDAQTCIANIEFVKKINNQLSDWITPASTSGSNQLSSFALWRGASGTIASALEDMIITSFGYTGYNVFCTLATVQFLGSFDNYDHLELKTKCHRDNTEPEYNSYFINTSAEQVSKLISTSTDVLAILNIQHTIYAYRT